MAVGLGTVDTPVPLIAEWEWLNWRFPRSIHAGDTLYARWVLTQKRPPVAGSPSSIVVWRVDVHTTDGALCAEGEIGARVKREAARASSRVVAPAAAAAPAPAASPSRRRRRKPRANGVLPEPPPIAAPPAPAAKPERAAGTSRRRRRRRPGGSTSQKEEHEPRAALVPERAPDPVPASLPAAAPAGTPADRGGISRVLKRLRRT